MEELRVVCAFILQTISNSQDQKILGVRLSNAVKRSYPTFTPLTFGCRNLRQFVRENLAEIREHGTSGADVVYGLNTGDVPAAARVALTTPIPPAPAQSYRESYWPLPIPSAHWKAYSNPSYPFVVAIHQDSYETTVVPESKEVHLPWRPVQKPSSDFHRKIAEEFVTSLPEGQQSQLSQRLADPKWFVSFTGVTNRLGLGSSWMAYRRRKLIDHYNQAVQGMGLTPKRLAAPYPDAKHHNPEFGVTSRGHTGNRDAKHAEDAEALRTVLRRALPLLSVQELRRFRLPLSVLVELMND